MLSFKNRIFKKNAITILIWALVLTGLFSYPLETHAATAEKKVTKYHLDIGAQHIWGTGSSLETATWEKGIKKGGPIEVSVSLNFPKEVCNVRAYPLTSSNFKWGIEGYSFNVTPYLHNGDDYDNNYKRYASTSIYNVNCSFSGNKVNLSYTALLKSTSDFDLKNHLNMGQLNYILDLMGGASAVQEHYPDIYNRLIEGAENGIADNVYGFLYFTPVVIEYDVIEEIPIEIDDFMADLDVPDSAKPGDTFTVKDTSVFGTSSQFALTELTYRVNTGSESDVVGWRGDSLGETISQSFNSECSVTYTIKVWNIYGDSKSASKTIKISDEHDIEIKPDLILPPYTYEGHKEIAWDQSTFIVDGIDYSAERTYSEGLARSTYKADSGTVSIKKLNNTSAEATFSQRGTYNITLDILADGGEKASDTETIEVRKTPYIIDNLSGFQKQNRKQILNITVATYPGKPLTDYSITLKDKVTGDLIKLTPDNLQANNSTIKTRAVTMTQDTEKGFAYIAVEFLTKTPSFAATGTNPQDFYYQIKVEDSKGDTDIASKTFSVQPDLPPHPAISIDTTFLRDEGTNTAAVNAEDITVAADGDEVDRSWHFGYGINSTAFTDVSIMEGYKKLSFGTDKIVGFNKTGIGKFTVKLDVKEVWTEPTLEEYVTEADYLTGSALSYSDVVNVAPIVSLEILKGTEQEILLLANNDEEYQTLISKKTELQQALLADKIDGRIIIKKLIGDTPSDITGVQQEQSLVFPYPTRALPSGLATETDEGTLLSVDSEKTYFLTYSWINGEPTVPKTIHAIDTYKGEVWRYTTNRNEEFILGHDDIGKYLYLIYPNSDQTVLIDKRTGAAAGIVDLALSGKMWLSDDLMFMVEGTNLYAVNANTLTKILAAENVSAVSRVDGKLQFISKGDNAIIRGTLDMKTMSIEKNVIFESASKNDYIPLCIDSTGRVVFWKDSGNESDKFRGIRVYGPDNRFIKEIAVTADYSDSSKQIHYSLDESGRCNHVLYWVRRTKSSPDENSFNAIDLNTGKVAVFNKNTDAYQNIWSSYAGSFESNGTSYFLFNGWYIHPGSAYYFGNNYTFTFTGSSCSMGVFGPASIGSLEESIKVSDRTVAALHGDNKPGTGYFLLKILAYPRTLAQETEEIVSRFTDKMTFIGNLDTTAETLNNRYTEQGMIANVKLEFMKSTGQILSVETSVIPTWVDKYKKNGKDIYTIIPLYGDFSKNPSLVESGHYPRAEQALADIKALLGEEYIKAEK
jgi:hypothetical protein